MEDSQKRAIFKEGLPNFIMHLMILYLNTFHEHIAIMIWIAIMAKKVKLSIFLLVSISYYFYLFKLSVE